MAKEEKIKVLLIEPGKKPQEVEVDNNLQSFQNIVGGYIQAVYPYRDDVALICNEEGKIYHMPLNRALRSEEGQIYDVIAGPIIITGLTDEDFGSLTPDLLEKYYTVYESPEKFARVGSRISVIKCPEFDGSKGTTVDKEEIPETGVDLW